MINELLKAVDIGALSWVERYGGLKRDFIFEHDGGTALYPIGAGVSGSEVYESGRYLDLAPRTGVNSVVYFEHIQDAKIEKLIKPRFSRYGFSAPLRLVAWLNLAELGVVDTTTEGIAPLSVVKRLTRSDNLEPPVSSSLHGKAFNVNCKNIFIEPKETTRALFTNYAFGDDQNLFFYPFDYFSIKFTLNWNVPLSCLTQIVPGTPIKCIDYS